MFLKCPFWLSTFQRIVSHGGIPENKTSFLHIIWNANIQQQLLHYVSIYFKNINLFKSTEIPLKEFTKTASSSLQGFCLVKASPLWQLWIILLFCPVTIVHMWWQLHATTGSTSFPIIDKKNIAEKKKRKKKSSIFLKQFILPYLFLCSLLCSSTMTLPLFSNNLRHSCFLFSLKQHASL